MPTASPSRMLLDSSRRSSPDLFTTRRPGDIGLTIHRRTGSHYGRTLKTLGHAAEYLADSRLLSIEGSNSADREAIHILMRLSRILFEEYAISTRQHHPITDWIMNQAVRIYGAA